MTERHFIQYYTALTVAGKKCHVVPLQVLRVKGGVMASYFDMCHHFCPRKTGCKENSECKSDRGYDVVLRSSRPSIFVDPDRYALARLAGKAK